MLYQVLIPVPILIPILVITTRGTHSPKNGSNVHSDVIVTYSNHAEASHEKHVPKIPDITTENGIKVPIQLKEFISAEGTKKPRKKFKKAKKESEEVEEVIEPSPEDVVFIPNNKDRSPIRNEYYLQKEHVSLGELMGGHKTIDEVLASKDVRLETEAPVSDIIFVMGKNDDTPEAVEKEKQEKKFRDRNDVTTQIPKLNCTNLNCNNAIKSVCGQKFDDNYQQRFRLFLNDCYFRKVNCNFKNPSNRFRKVNMDKCKDIGTHSQAPFSFSYKPPQKPDPQFVLNDTRRSSTSSRRSMSMNIHGQFCSHPCPVSCPEHYEPECAVSSTGRHRVFVNHCALDHNSCSFGIVWQSVPLAQCVGGKKADMRQNAGFIGWMQRVGIVDKRGRLAYDA